MLDDERLEREIFREIARERRANVFRSLISFPYASLSLSLSAKSRERKIEQGKREFAFIR